MGVLIGLAAIWAMFGTITIQEELFKNNLRETSNWEIVKHLLLAVFYGPFTRSKVIPRMLKEKGP